MLRFMKNKILIPLLILGALAAFFSFRYTNNADTSVSEQRKKLIIQTVMKAINAGHFSPREVNDSFSHAVYEKTLTSLDYGKRLFTKQDIDILKTYEYRLDDPGDDTPIEFFNKVNEIFTKRSAQAEVYYKEILSKPFDFSANEVWAGLNADKSEYAADETMLKDNWRKYLKYRTLAKYVDLKKAQEKKKENKDSVNAKFKTDAELEADARSEIAKSEDYYFKRLKKFDDEKRFATFVNSVTNTEDPHTDYFPPEDKKRFDEMMSGTFFGIGAVLSPADGKITVSEILAGSPCWRQGELKSGDEILKVAQADSTPVDIQGYDIDDAVKLIRGPKGTEVRLTVKKVDGSQKVIPIIRGEVQRDETFAKSAIIKGEDGPVGYIYLPEFYSDFQHINGRRCAEDVAIEVMKLKNAGVRGIILDLRNNGGGSLSDVVDMTGLFIDRGPVVQVKTINAAPVTLEDRQPGILYDGPMVVMVNQSSASASEIMAAAMQDYKRAVIVGSTTFGKGTVQQIKSLDEFMSWSDKLDAKSKGIISDDKPIGSVKLTIQKFYRVNGGSTQLKGVVPDITLPDPYELIEIGERSEKSALKWDEIPPANYMPVDNVVSTTDLANSSKKRTAANPSFQLIKESALRNKQQQDENTASLNETEYRKKLDEINANAKKTEEAEKKAKQLTVVNLKDDMPKINLDSTNIKKNETWIKNLQKDIYLSETVNILNDLAKMDTKVRMGTGMK